MFKDPTKRLKTLKNSIESSFTSEFQLCRRVKTPVSSGHSLFCKTGNCLGRLFRKNFLRIILISQQHLVFCGSSRSFHVEGS